MEKRNETLIKLAQTGFMAALCFVAFTFLKIKIPMPGGDATALHIGNAFCVLGALIMGGWYGGLAGAVGMTIADILDPAYIVSAPKTFVLKLCIGLIVGFVAHHAAKIDESTDKKYILRWSVMLLWQDWALMYLRIRSSDIFIKCLSWDSLSRWRRYWQNGVLPRHL